MCETKKLPELFGSLVFNEGTMKERLSSASYSAWKKCVTEGTPWTSPPPMRSLRP